MEGGEEVFANLKNKRSGGMPWMTILDGDGKEIVSSVGPKGNVGCPVQPFEIEHFVNMIKQSSDATEEELGSIKEALTAYAEKLQ